jgi:predicted porin
VFQYLLSSANNSTWDVDLGYTAGGFALAYGVDETDGWTATATTALGGGATFKAGVETKRLTKCMQAYHSHSNPNWI